MSYTDWGRARVVASGIETVETALGDTPEARQWRRTHRWFAGLYLACRDLERPLGTPGWQTMPGGGSRIASAVGALRLRACGWCRDGLPHTDATHGAAVSASLAWRRRS